VTRVVGVFVRFFVRRFIGQQLFQLVLSGNEYVAGLATLERPVLKLVDDGPHGYCNSPT
jgi:hypothetical protein